MAKIILVSNRVATVSEGKPSAGGLAVAVVEALQGDKCLWLGWNGKVGRLQDETIADHGKIGTIETRTWPLSQKNYDGYYRGFSNSVLWPAFHNRLDHMRFLQEDYQSYLRVNQQFAKRLAETASPNDIIWVHDYHFIPLAHFCRELGLENKIGFFLHIPFPQESIFSAVPVHQKLAQAMSSYNLVGFQTNGDLHAFAGYHSHREDLDALSDTRPNISFPLPQRMGIYPISIDCLGTVKEMEAAQKKRTLGRLHREFVNNQLIISVERLDYTKGLLERLAGYEEFLRRYPAKRGSVNLIQISPPSRTDVHGYGNIRREVEQRTSQINGKWAEPSWMPINYINRNFDRPTLLTFFRRCDIALVTSLRDGMNLVAKEYVSVQAPDNPGVLILSQFAGAAKELCTGALIVNPYDSDAIADAIYRALTMNVEERQRRHAAMMQVLQTNTLYGWKRSFLEDLKNSPIHSKCGKPLLQERQ